MNFKSNLNNKLNNNLYFIRKNDLIQSNNHSDSIENQLMNIQHQYATNNHILESYLFLLIDFYIF